MNEMLDIIKGGGPVASVSIAAMYLGYRLMLQLIPRFSESLDRNTKAVSELTQALIRRRDDG